MLPFGLTVDDIRLGVSRVRNRVLAQVFRELGYVEQWGSGIGRMSAACIETGLAVPADQDDLDDRLVWIGVGDRGVELIAIDQGERLLVIESHADALQERTEGGPMSKRYELKPGVVDLDTTEEYDTRGNRIDSAYVDRVVDDVHAKLRAGLRSRAPVPPNRVLPHSRTAPACGRAAGGPRGGHLVRPRARSLERLLIGGVR
jgi:hypothetical protein